MPRSSARKADQTEASSCVIWGSVMDASHQSAPGHDCTWVVPVNDDRDMATVSFITSSICLMPGLSGSATMRAPLKVPMIAMSVSPYCFRGGLVEAEQAASDGGN